MIDLVNLYHRATDTWEPVTPLSGGVIYNKGCGTFTDSATGKKKIVALGGTDRKKSAILFRVQSFFLPHSRQRGIL